MRHITLLFGAMAVLALLPASAIGQSQWGESFDAYDDGLKLYDVGGWSGWDDDPNAAGTVTSDQALSKPHSVVVSNSMGVDAVHPFDPPYDAGSWVFTAFQYIPDNLDGATYFILNNVYAPPTHEWAMQINMDPATGMVTEQIHGGSSTPIVYNAWAEIRVKIDLDLDTADAYYNNVLIYSGSWTSINYPTLEFANVDLYAPHEVGVYYDHFSFVPEPASCLLLALGALVGLRRR